MKYQCQTRVGKRGVLQVQPTVLLPSTPNEQDGVLVGEHTRVAGTVSEEVPVTVIVLPSHCQLRHSTVTVGRNHRRNRDREGTSLHREYRPGRPVLRIQH
jgi:hypothetical protein